jgi:predicted transposase YbfD/YdcC
LIVLRSERTVKKTSATSTESRYYLSSAPPQEYQPQGWLDLIRGHWGGVEVRNHWRRDALMGEDRSRSRQANLLANVALLRNAVLQILSQHFQEQSLPKIRETLHSRPGQCLALLKDS